MVSGQLPPEEYCPSLRVGVWVKVRVSFRVAGKPDNCPRRKLPPPPPPQVRLRVSVMVNFGIGGKFSAGAFVLIMQILREVFIGGKCLKGRDI